jgi:hypothetical protein
MPRGVYRRGKATKPKPGTEWEKEPTVEPLPLDRLRSSGRILEELWLRPAIAALKEQPPRMGLALDRLEMAQNFARWLANTKE